LAIKHAELAAKTAEIEALRGSADQQRFAAQEVSHRILNGLQLLTTALHMQKRHVADACAIEILETARLRIEAMGRVHRHLCASRDGRTVDFGRYLEELVEAISESIGLSCIVKAESVSLDYDIAAGVGVAVNELLTNAAKHAGGLSEKPVEVGARRERGRLFITVRDHGPGLPERLPSRDGRSLGMMLVDTAVQRLRGHFLIENCSDGACLTLAVPV
jgi:two-component sensor histidine kinase